MIKSFKCKNTEILFFDGKPKVFTAISKVARMRLIGLNIAACLNDLKIPPGNKLEALKGNRQGQYSIRINKQWRICFKWDGINAYDVEIVDYH
jgi:proteic killer suppression protein